MLVLVLSNCRPILYTLANVRLRFVSFFRVIVVIV